MQRVLKLQNFLKNNHFIKGSVIIFVGNMVANVSSYAYHLVVGRILGPVGYGEFASLLSLFYIVNVPSEVIRQILVKYFSITKASNNPHQAKYIFWKATKLLTIGTILGGVIIMPFAGSIASFLHLKSWMPVFWLYLIFATFFLTMINATALQGYQKFFDVTLYTNIAAALRLLIGTVAAFWGVQWTLVGNIISNLLAYVAHFLPIKFILREKEEKFSLTKRDAVNYGLPVFLSTLGMTLLFSQDVVLVKHLFQASDAGIYSSLAVLGKVIFFASSAISVAIFPVIAEKKQLGQNTFSIILSGVGSIAMISSCITSIYFLFPTTVVRLLFGSAYIAASLYVGWFGVFLSLYSIASILSSSCLAIGLTRVWIFPISASIVQTLVLYYFSQNSLQSVIMNNVYITGFLVVSILVYYLYAKERS